MRETIKGVVYTYGELKTLSYLVGTGKVSLSDIADYCGVRKTAAHGYIAALIAKGLARQDGSVRSSVRYWCTDKTRAQDILDGVEKFEILKPGPSLPAKAKGNFDGIELSLNELRILKRVLEAAAPLTSIEIARLNGWSVSYVPTLLKSLVVKQLLDRKLQQKGRWYYWCKDPERVRNILGQVDKI